MLKPSALVFSPVVLAVLALPLLTRQEEESADETANTVTEPARTYEEARTLARNTPGYENLHRIGLAFHGYHDIFGQFPPAIIYDSDGKVPHSWRVELLPVLKHYVDGIEPDRLSANVNRDQYNTLIADCGYDISQLWDSPENRPVLEAVDDYRHPNDVPESVSSAFYAVVGTGTALDPAQTAQYSDIKGWPATTLMIVESRCNEPWTKPVDVLYSESATVPRFGGFTDKGSLVMSCDGAVHFVSVGIPPNDLRAFISTDTTDAFAIVGVPYQYR